MSYGRPIEPDNTCPMIDDVISEVNKIRKANTALRDWGHEWKDRAEEAEGRVDELESEVSGLEKRIEKLEAELAESQQGAVV